MRRFIIFLLTMIFFISICVACVRQDTGNFQLFQSSLGSTAELSPSSEAAPQSGLQPELTEREKGWRGDFAYFKRHYLMYHPDPFYYISEEEFDWQIEQLAKKVNSLSDMDIYFELAKIVAGLGDNHTVLDKPDGFYDQVFPIGVKFFGEKLYLCGYLKGYEQFGPYQLHEIVSINGVDIQYLLKKAGSVTAPTNEWDSKDQFEKQLFSPHFFDWAGCNTETGYTVQLLDDDQKVVSVEMPVVKNDPNTAVVVAPENREKLPRLQETGVKLFETEKGNYVYLAFIGTTMYDKGNFYHELTRQTASLLKEHPGSKLVVDLREHYGGDERAVDDIKSDIALLKESYKPETYVITGGGTMSAAIKMLLTFKQEIDAVQVGEPTGQFTSFWGYSNPITMTMPSSQISFHISNHFGEYTTENTYYDENGKLYEWENTILPDVYVSQTLEDFKEGKDSVIEWVLEQ